MSESTTRPDSKPDQLANAPKKTRPRVIAFTGASSFLGNNLIGFFEEDPRIRRVVALDVRPPLTAGSKTRYYELDLTRPTATEHACEILSAEQADVLVHLAFLASPTPAEAWAHELESVGTMNILNAAREAKIPKLVQWSQTLLYGALPNNPNHLTEDHPLRASRQDIFFGDKIEAEAEAIRFGKQTGASVTVLRTAPILGPTVGNYVTRYLARRFVPTLMGFDPLVQFVHEVDAITAFKIAIQSAVSGTFNIVGEGVLPLSTVIRLAGRVAMPIPHLTAPMMFSLGWAAQVGEAPSSFIQYLRYVCVADGAKATEQLGFKPAFTVREALIDYANAQRLRDAKLLHDPGYGVSK